MLKISEQKRQWWDAQIKRLTEQEGLTKAEIARRLGISPQEFNNVHSGTRGLTDNFLDRFIETFGVNSVDLFEQTDSVYKPEINDESQDFIGQPIDERRTIPLLPLLAQGGKLNDFVVSVGEYDCERIISPIRDAQLAITVSGESMAPEYPAGSVVLVKRIDERKFIEWGRAYIVDTANGVVIKYLAPSDKGEGYIRCISLNPEPRYAPFDISLSDVFGVYRVLICMSIK